MAEEMTESLAERWINALKNWPVIAGLIVGGAVLAWIATFSDSIGKISKFLFPPASSPSTVQSNVVYSPTTNSVTNDNRQTTIHNGISVGGTYLAGTATGTSGRLIRPDVKLFEKQAGAEGTGADGAQATIKSSQTTVPLNKTSRSAPLEAVATPTVSSPAVSSLPDPGQIHTRISREDMKYTTRGPEMFISDIDRKIVWVWDGSVNRFTRAFSYEGKLSDTPIPLRVFICGNESFLVATNENESLSAIFGMNLDNGDINQLGGESKQASPPPYMGCYNHP